MPTRHRRIFAAVLVTLLASGSALAQDVQSNGVIGAPELRDFRLPGTRVAPPPNSEPATPPASTPPAAATERAQPAGPATRPPATSQPAPAAPRSSAPSPDSTATVPATRSAPTEDAGPAASGTPVAAPPVTDVYPAQEFEAPAAPLDIAEPVPEEFSSEGSSWPALTGGVAILLALLFFYRRRRRAAAAGAAPELEPAAVPEMVEPAPVRRPVTLLKEQDDELQPVIEIEFKPERMVATALQAAVHFDLMVRNAGKSAARNLRIEARMFNASAQQQREIAAFLAAPVPADGQVSAVAFQPDQAAQMRSSVVMPKESVREIRIDGRPLFIPTVVVRVVYQWGRGRSGQAHKTYLVGIENQNSSEKMGPFRLDMGPRIYRSVGGRQIELARAS